SIKVDLLADGLDNARLPGNVETALYRIAQEALTNVLRHAGAGHVTIALNRGPTHVRMTVADDGRGFEPGVALGTTGHFGLHGIRERAALLKGTARFDSTPGAGTRITVELPVEGHDED
ncbi:MAG: sensor histidine kinase, partial [Candidatus Binatia bacterium]